MEFPALFTIGVLVLVFGLLAFSRRGPDVILLGGLSLLLIAGIVDPREAFSGFASEGLWTVGVLFIVATGVKNSGAVNLAVSWLYGKPRNLTDAQVRVIAPVTLLSGFMNNTPLVLILLPIISDWAKKFRIAVSKLLIPLSYASLLGGMCTLIGTSTNLVVNGLIQSEANKGVEGVYVLQLFDISFIGVPAAFGGTIFLLTIGRFLLPDRQRNIGIDEDAREYSVEMIVTEDGPLVNKTIEGAGLRHLPGLYLMEIERGNDVIPAVGPEVTLKGNDRLVFVGVVDSVLDLQKIRGLQPATNQVFKLTSQKTERVLIEAVVSDSSPMLGRTIREGQFRTRYDAVIIAVSRNGERIRKKVGDITLRPGDTLMLEALPSFITQQRNSRDFYLVSQVEDFAHTSHDKAWIALGILVLMITMMATETLSVLNSALIATALLLFFRCMTGNAARKSIDWRILVTIGAAIGIGEAMKLTGAANSIAQTFLQVGGGNLLLSFIVVYFTTVLFTELITNNAAAILMFPIALEVSQSFGVSPMPFLIAVMFAASASFATPIGYQTHLMVYGPGGYRFKDFLKIGIPMNLFLGIIIIILIPLIFPFNP